MVEDAHQAEEMLRWYGVVDLVVSEQVVRGLNQEQLQNTFHDDLPEDPSPLVQ